MYRLLAVAVTGVLIAGCATSKAKAVSLADGSKVYPISCDGMALSAGDCLEKAGATCGASGFTIVDQRGEAVPIATASAELGRNGGAVTRSLFVKCK